MSVVISIGFLKKTGRIVLMSSVLNTKKEQYWNNKVIRMWKSSQVCHKILEIEELSHYGF